MDEKPIDQAELDQLITQMRTKRNALAGWTAVVTELSLAALAAHHEDWLMLYQLGQEISHIAERLDSIYQAQFSTSAPEQEDLAADVGDASQENPRPAPDHADLDEKLQSAKAWLENIFGNVTAPRGFTREMSNEAILAEMARNRLEWVQRDGYGYWFDRESAFYREYETWYRNHEFDLIDEGAGPAPEPESFLAWAKRESFTNHRLIDPENDFFWWL